ncbi:hypothetical protein GCM10007242_39980 [Pigmentiphaga litoralis]|nr:hypothetical protein GCM10007242_39980 [Pigmentiphaga litoralis]
MVVRARLGNLPVWARRSLKIGGGVVAGWLLLSGLAAWRVPILVQDLAASQSAAILGRPARIDTVTFNPFTLVLRARGVHVFEPDGTTPLLTVAGLDVDASITSVFRLAPVLDRITVTEPRLALVREDTRRFNISDILERLAARPAGDGGTPRFSLNNVSLQGGDITLQDKVTGRTHTVQSLDIGLPFLSTLPYAVEIDVLPRLTAVINGSPLDLGGRARPFDASRTSSLDFHLDGLALDAFADAWPLPYPVALRKGTLDAQLQMVFDAPPDVAPTFRISGDVALNDVDIRSTPDDAALMQVKTLAVKDMAVEPLARRVTIGRVEVVDPQVNVTRNAAGEVNVVRVATPQPGAKAPATTTATSSAPVPEPVATSAAAPAATAAATAAATPSVPAASAGATATAKPLPAAADAPAATAVAPTAPRAPTAAPAAWQVAVKEVDLTGGNVRWQDAKDNFGTSLSGIALKVSALNFPDPSNAPATLSLNARVADAGAVKVTGPIRLQPLSADLDASLTGLALPALAPLWKPYVALAIDRGTLDVKAKVRASQASSGMQVAWNDGAVSIKQLRAAPLANPESQLQFDQLALQGLEGDLQARRAHLGAITLSALNLAAQRDRSGAISWASLTNTTVAVATDASTRQPTTAADPKPGKGRASKTNAAAPATPAAPWTVSATSVAVTDSAVRFTDESVTPRVNARLDDLRLTTGKLAWPATAPIAFTLSSGLQRGGKLEASGKVTPSPLAVNADLTATRLNLTAFAPYIAERINATVASLVVGAKGRLDFTAAAGRAPQSVAWKGSADVNDLTLLDKANRADFLRWRRLGFKQLDVKQQGDVLTADLGDIALQDFFARVILRESGRLNLRELLVTPGEEGNASITQAASERGGNGKAQATVDTAPDTGKRTIRVGGLQLSRGNINFTDNFVKPNYTANLTDIEGGITALATDRPEPANVTLKGRVDGNAPVDIRGKVQPFGEQLYTDITASAKGVDLPGLTPYAAKYAGYPIERGKLSMDVHYLIEDGKLTASNKVLLDQLTFGDRVDGPSVLNLPVRLAVSLLKNSRGEINLDLPVAGSLDDPQFSIGSVVFRALGNLIVRAVTSPFSLIASAFGGSGSQELSYVEFEPGRAALSSTARSKIDTLVKALKDRPALKLDISGRADPAVDTDALRTVGVEQMMLDQKRRVVTRRNDVDPATITLQPGDESTYLEAAYKAARFDKPRNAIGLTKSLPDDEMQSLLAAQVEVGAPQLRELAVRRAQSVMAVLREAGLSERAFIITPHTDANGVKDGKTTRVDFSLK